MHARNKILSLCGVASISEAVKSRGEAVILTSGCFDLLHGGHYEYLYEASQKGYLIVGINNDAFVKRLKDKSRPIRDENDRALLIAALEVVRQVVVFDSDYDLIDAVKPNVYATSKTSHVRIWEDTGRIELLNEMGTEIVEIDSKKKDSTTDIIKRASVRVSC